VRGGKAARLFGGVIVAALLFGAAAKAEAIIFNCPWGWWLCGSGSAKK
jgi:hypothetical protein